MFRFCASMILLVVTLELPAWVEAQSGLVPPQVAPREFAIMAWDSAPSDPEQLHSMKEAGLNIAGFCSVSDLDRVQAAQLSCFVEDARVSGYDWENLPAENEIRSKMRDLAQLVERHTTVVGFFLRDEPRAPAMPGLGRVANMLREVVPDTWPYVNLLAAYASPARLGAADYESYVRKLVEAVHPPFISYDNYSLVEGEMRDFFCTNLEIVRRVSLEAKISFWNCVLANAHWNVMEPSDATFNIQVYSTLAYGGRGIEYFTYFTPRQENYRMAAIDPFGYRTPTWDMMRRVNYQIHALAPALIRLRSTGVYHSPEVPTGCRPLADSPLVKDVEMLTPSIVPMIRPRFLVGEFEDPQGRPYLMIVNKDLRYSFLYHPVFKKEVRKTFRISPYSGQEESLPQGYDWIAPGAGALLRVE